MNPTEQAMLGVVEETFASLAFMFPVEPDADAAGQDPPTAQRATVDFSGPFRGCLRLSVSPGMLEPLGANMLGLEDDAGLSSEQKLDAFKELLNVLCGNLLPVIASPRDVFNVHEPRLLAGDDDNLSAPGLAERGTVDVDLDAGHVRLTLLLENQTAAAVTAPTESQL